MNRPLCITGVQLYGSGGPQELCMAGRRIVAARPRGAQVVDLGGCTVLPGLINAHDHLELNHYPRTKFRFHYPNAHEWGEEVSTRLDDEPYRSLRAWPLWDRLLVGGLKNLLSGVTTVIHHGPPHRELFRQAFPVSVLRPYRWAHSLHFDTAEHIVQTYRAGPAGVPWFIHLAEGTDALARGEYRRLAELGCVGPDTVIVHAVGLNSTDITAAASRVRGLVWCPSTSLYLLGQARPLDEWTAAGGRAALGSDSRLTADGDLLDELHAAAAVTGQNIHDMLPLAMEQAAALAGLPDAGHLRPGARADWWVPGDSMRRADVRLVVRGGVPQIGEPELMCRFPGLPATPATLDGRPRLIHTALARLVWQGKLKEPGLVLDQQPAKRFRLF